MSQSSTIQGRSVRRGRLGRVLALLALVALLVTTSACSLLNGTDTKENGSDVGACAAISGSSFDADFKQTDCDEPDATWVVVAKGETCDEYETEYTETINGNESVQLCLWFNAKAGECISNFDSSGSPAAKVDCAEVKGDPSAAKVLTAEDSAKAKCGKRADLVLKNKTRDKTLCVTTLA